MSFHGARDSRNSQLPSPNSVQQPWHDPTGGRKHHISLSAQEGSSSSCGSDGIPPSPPPAAYYSPRQRAMDDQLGDFFGAKKSPKNIPPPYASQGDLMGQLPTYETSLKEPTTLARFTFLLGFVFPPAWIMGIVILSSELTPSPSWDIGKTEEQKVAHWTEMRKIEVKWAKRSVWALFTLILVITVIVVAVVFAKRR